MANISEIICRLHTFMQIQTQLSDNVNETILSVVSHPVISTYMRLINLNLMSYSYNHVCYFFNLTTVPRHLGPAERILFLFGTHVDGIVRVLT